MKLLFIMLLGGCVVELKTTSSSKQHVSESDYNQKYDYDYEIATDPDYYTWDCWDSQYYWDSTVTIEAFDCYAYHVEVEIEHDDFNIEYDTLDYYGNCEWYSSTYIEYYECAEIYDVTVTAYY